MSLQTMPTPTRTRHPHALTPDELARLTAMGTIGRRSLPPLPGAHTAKPKAEPSQSAPRRNWKWMRKLGVGQSHTIPNDKKSLKQNAHTCATQKGIRISIRSRNQGLTITRIS